MVAAGILDLGLDLDVWPWVWLAVAVVFALVELTFMGGTFVLLPFAASAFVAALLAFYDVAIEVQWAVFVFGGAVLFFLAYRWVRKFLDAHALPVGVGADRLIGLKGYITAAVDPTDTSRRGRVQIEGEVWGAITTDGSTLDVGQSVTVTEVIGTRVVVAPVETSRSTSKEGSS